MRILNISFKNINSLEGEGRIDFDQGPIADSGVFAITGPNGSGKTSILDVITLGLYGETFRFDKPADHVITKQTSDSFAAVEFALDGETFRSSWQVTRTASDVEPGQALQPQMTLTRLNGEEELLARSPSTVRSRIAELTGMDFHKFSKSMVLPQGDFAAFLNALDSERMDILEKICGTAIYASYKQQAENNFLEASNGLAQIRQDIELIPLLSPEAQNAAEQDLQDFREQVVAFKGQQVELRQQIQHIQHVASVEVRQQQLLKQAGQVEAQIADLEADLQRIVVAQQATQFREEITLLDSKQRQITESQSTLAVYRQELVLLQQQVALVSDNPEPRLQGKTLAEQKQAIDSLKLKVSELKLELPRETELAQAAQMQLDEKLVSLAEVENWLQGRQTDAVLLNEFPDVIQLRNLRTELAELATNQKKQASWTKSTSTDLKKNQTALSETKAALADLHEQIESARKNMASLEQGKSFEELKELLQEQKARVDDFQELYSLANVNAKFSKKGFFSWFSRTKEPELPDENRLQTQLDELQEQLEREDNIVKALEQAVMHEALLKRYSNDRSKLVDGKPCFLCGSLHHPYIAKPPSQTNSKKALIDQRSRLQTLKTAVANVSSQLEIARKRGSQMSARQQRLLQIRSEWRVLSNRLNVVSEELDIDNLSLQKRLLAEEIQELEKIKDLVNEHAQLQRDLAKWTADIENKQALLEKLNAVNAQLQSTWDNRPPEFLQTEQRFNQLKADEKALIAKLEKQLAALGEKLPGKGKENVLFDRLNGRKQDYQIRELRQQGLQEEIASLRGKLEVSQGRIIECQQQMSDSLAALQTEEWLGLHLAVLEKQKLIAETERQVSILQLELEAMERVLGAKIEVTNFKDIQSLRDAIALTGREAEIAQRIEQYRQQLATVNTELGLVEHELQQVSPVGSVQLSEQQLLEMLRQIDRKLDIAEQEVAALENKLNKQQTYREKFQALQARLAEQQVLFEQADAEIKLISDERGGFRRRIQQLLVDKLLSQANQILEKLSGRYYVRSVASDHGLALEIEDTKQKNQRRLPKTLSGGESFVVSLALALALSEIANNGKAIDSLFLDEGFGNLDAEALYLAMTTLESLKTQGKTVGVISHVDAVKKRIKTQIELVKKSNGLSELKLVA